MAAGKYVSSTELERKCRLNSPTEREAKLLGALVEEQTIIQDQADAFLTIHDRLAESGWMPL